MPATTHGSRSASAILRMPVVNTMFVLSRAVGQAASLVTFTRHFAARQHLTRHPAGPNLLPHNLSLPDARPPRITSAVFVKSSMELSQMPRPVGPELAFIGHSNVGKSSLINMLLGSQDLAKVSKQPGKTRCINHFLVNGKFYLVDCPGYGYARVSKQDRERWHHLTQEYLTERPGLAHAYLLVDATMQPNAMDVDAAAWLHEHEVPYTLVFTKVDGSDDSSSPRANADADHSEDTPSIVAVEETVKTVLRAVQAVTMQAQRFSGGPPASGAPRYVLTSSKTKLGRDVLLSHLCNVQRTFDMPLMFR